ncbi:MAG: helix-turn-helix domain-containing protein, partial [Treponema sp.]|nr:helix-turn-helix domain-containing protein [Treponema sp.]
SAPLPSTSGSAITPRDRETIIELKRRGWTVDDIARRMKRSVGEVELILEMPN